MYTSSELRLVFLNLETEDPNSFDNSNSDQVAAVYVDDESEVRGPQYLHVKVNGGGVTYIAQYQG